MDYQAFERIASTYGLIITQKQYDDLLVYAKRLIDYNQKVNLTAIIELDQIFIKHFLDSLLVVKYIGDGQKVADVGTGAGFPGLVLALFLPNCMFTLIEPTQKRVVFLQSIKEELDLSNVEIQNERAEDLKHLKETFDVVVSRAVARLDILLELCIPLVRVKGTFIALKGAQGKAELSISENALKVLKAKVKVIEEIILDDGQTKALRQNIVIEKEAKTPNIYPRLYSKIKKQPL